MNKMQSLLITLLFPILLSAQILSYPTSIQVTAVGTEGLQLNWVDTSLTERYLIERRVGRTGNFNGIYETLPGVRSYIDTTALPDVEYSYRIRARATETGSNYSSFSPTVYAKIRLTDSPPPPPPPPPPPITNQAPVVNAGPDQVVLFPTPAILNGTASDDGLPTGSTLAVTWTKFNGPGNVTFGGVNARATTATFSVVGSYVLRLSVTDGSLTRTDDVGVTVSVEPEPSPPPPPPPTATGNFFVSPSGNDAANGSLATPWKTIAKALLATGPGATVNLRAGTYTETIEMRGDPGNRFGKTMGGSPAGWWTLQSYPGEQATVAGDFSAYSVQYTRFQNIHWTTNLGVGTADWISPLPPRSHHVEILSNTLTGPQPRYGFIEVKFDDSLVAGNTIAITTGGTTTDHGIYLHNGARNILRGNTISGASGYNIHVYDERKGSGDAQTFYDDVVIEGNTLTGSRQRSGLIVSQGGDTVVRSIIVRDNKTSGNNSFGADLTNYGSRNMQGLRILNNEFRDGIFIGNSRIIDCQITNNIVGSAGITGEGRASCTATGNTP